MSDEMEIMREFKNVVKRKDPNNEQEIYGVIGRVHCWLPDAVKREICRVIKSFNAYLVDAESSEEEDLIYRRYLAKYSPAPQYCEGMQEAIDNHRVWRYANGDWMISMGNSGSNGKIIYCCPFCKDGKNCIGGKG